MQLISPFMVHRLGSHKRWVMMCATVQAISFIPLVIAATFGRMPGWAVLIVASVYWGSGLASSPAWNTWVGTIVPRPIRAQYFARRTKLMQAAVMTGFLAAGIALHVCAQYDLALYAFAGIFAGAALARVVSVTTLAMQSEPTPIPANMQAVSTARSNNLRSIRPLARAGKPPVAPSARGTQRAQHPALGAPVCISRRRLRLGGKRRLNEHYTVFRFRLVLQFCLTM